MLQKRNVFILRSQFAILCNDVTVQAIVTSLHVLRVTPHCCLQALFFWFLQPLALAVSFNIASRMFIAIQD